MSARTKFLFWSEILHLSRKLFAMARPILCSQEDLNAVEMQDVTSEGHNTLAQDVRDAGPPKRITTENDNNNAKEK